MRKTIFVLTVLASLAASGCFRNERTELPLSIPEMRSEADAAKIRKALDGLAGAVEVKSVDLEGHVVTVVYDNVRLGRRNVETAVSHAGYDVNDWPSAEKRK